MLLQIHEAKEGTTVNEIQRHAHGVIPNSLVGYILKAINSLCWIHQHPLR